MNTIVSNIRTTNMRDVKKSLRDAGLFAVALFLTSFLGGLDPHSVFANTPESVKIAAMNGLDAVYSAWLALLMPMLMRTVRSSPKE